MDDCENNCEYKNRAPRTVRSLAPLILVLIRLIIKLWSSFACVQNGKVRLINLSYTSTLLNSNSLIITNHYISSSPLRLPYIINYTVLEKVGSRHTYRHLGVIRVTSFQPHISLAFCRAEDLPYFCSASISSSSTLCFLLSLRSFLQVFHQLRIFYVALAP